MASDDIAQLVDSLSKTHICGGELSFKGRGLKLDNAASVEDLVHEINHYPCLEALCLEGNTFGVDAAQAIAQALESKDLLQRCYWSDMFTGRLRTEIPTALRSLGHALMIAGAKLTELDLSDNAFGPDGVRGIEQLLKSPTCYTLRELKLNNCGMGSGGGKILAKALIESYRQSSALGSPLKLRLLIVGRNRLENEGARALAKAFQLIGSLEEVHMPQNGINHEGVTALALAMQHNPDLRILNFNDNTFTKKGTLAMAQALRHLRNVQVLNFGDCLVRCEGAIALAAVIREGLPVLKELNLSFDEISEAAAMVVAQAVMTKPHMEKLDLNGNCLGEEGCEALREAMENVDKGDVLAALSDDEGEPDEDVEDDEDHIDQENSDYDDACDNSNEDEEDEIVKDNGIIKENGPEKSQGPAEILSFPSCPPAEKLLQLSEMKAKLQQQVDGSDPHQAADVFLKIASLYDEEPETKAAVLETIDGMLKNLLSASALQSNSFLSSLLIMLGLLKAEDKVKPVTLVPGQLLCLEHAVQQEYFMKQHTLMLHSFFSRNHDALKSCREAVERLMSALEQSDYDDACDNSNEDEEDEVKEDEIVKDNGIIKENAPEKSQGPAEILSFPSCPPAEKLLQLSEMKAKLQQQVDGSDPHQAADVFLKIASLYDEESETKAAVLETIDGMLKNLLSASALQSNSFLSSLLIMMGLLKAEDKVKPVTLVPGQLLCLEHAVQQEYFRKQHTLMLHSFFSRNHDALKSCRAAVERLMSALEQRCNDD